MYVIFVAPKANGVTTPETTDATDISEEDHGVVGWAVAEPVRVTVDANPQALKVPEIVGSAFTVKVAFTLHPLLSL